MLITHHFLFTAEVISPLELDDHSGSALRGNLFEALWKRFCTNKSAPSCAGCPLHTACPVSALVAPLREENPRGQDIPRPYILLPPLGEARKYERGQTLLFGLTLFGTIIQLLPYIIMSVHVLEENGLGRKLPENAGERGRFRITQIDAYHPFTGERNCLYQRGKALVQASTLSVSATDVTTRAVELPTDQITLNFLTPTRIVEHEQLLMRPSFRSLILRLSERFANLTMAYSETTVEEVQNDQPDLITLATNIACLQDTRNWEEVSSYSRRQHRFTSISGFMGPITFTGDLTPFRELLTWGELIHVGKNTVKGGGWYKIVV